MIPGRVLGFMQARTIIQDSIYGGYLGTLRSQIDLPWTIIGDFNEILLPSEHKGGIFSYMKADHFAQALNTCDMLDMEFFGTKFTWQGNCRGNRAIAKRLDRGVCDCRWRLMFPEATMQHLVKRHSDHNTLLMRCSTRGTSRQDHPFRFQAVWCTHNEYHNVVKEAWKKDGSDVVTSLHNVSTDSITFNKEVFGNIFEKKRKLESWLWGIQKALEDIDSVR